MKVCMSEKVIYLILCDFYCEKLKCKIIILHLVKSTSCSVNILNFVILDEYNYCLRQTLCTKYFVTFLFTLLQ